MGFKIESTKIDFGSINIENIFINDYMPTANGTFVKVYLLGYKYALDVDSNIKFNNSLLAKHLNIPLEDVLNAWEFWEKRGVIKRNILNDEINYDVEFISLRQLYIDNNYSLKTEDMFDTNEKVGNSELIAINKDKDVKDMFKKIDYFMRRPLAPNERLDIINYLLNNNVDTDVMVMGVEFSTETKNVRNIKYALKVISNWLDRGLNSVEEIENSLKESNKFYTAYRKIYKSLGYSNMITSGDKEIIDEWLLRYKLSLSFILEVIKESSKKTSNVNMNYINSIIIGLYKDGIDTKEKYIEFLKTVQSTKNNRQTKKTLEVKKTRFHNFDGDKEKLTNEEIEKILGIEK